MLHWPLQDTKCAASTFIAATRPTTFLPILGHSERDTHLCCPCAIHIVLRNSVFCVFCTKFEIAWSYPRRCPEIFLLTLPNVPNNRYDIDSVLLASKKLNFGGKKYVATISRFRAKANRSLLLKFS